MKNSVIIEFFVMLFHKLVEVYDNSLIAKTIEGICSFFKKNAKNSFFVRIFKHGILTDECRKNSLVYRGYCGVFEAFNKQKSPKSRIGCGLLNILNIKLQSLGFVFLSLSVGISLAMLVHHDTKLLNILTVVGLFIIGVVFVIFKLSISELWEGSKFISFIGNLFYLDSPEHTEYIINTKLCCAVALILGFFGGLESGFLFAVTLIGILFCLAVLMRYEIGLYSTLLLSAVLPTAVVAGLCVITVVGFFIQLRAGTVQRITPSRFAPFIGAYILFGAFSTATSFDMKSSIFIYAIYLVFIAMYFVMVNSLTTEKRWKTAIACFAIGALMISIYGIYQNFFLDTTAEQWVDKEMFEDIKTRVYATFDNPNVLGQYFIIIIPIITSVFICEKKHLKKLVWLTVLAFSLLCLIYTWSRGAWIGVMLGLVVYLLLRDKRFFALCILGVFILPFVLPQSVLQRLASLGNISDSSTAYRVSVWIGSARMAMDFWMSGVGYGSKAFAAVYSSYGLNGATFAMHSHNFYIQMVCDVGIGGLVALLLVIYTAYREISTIDNKTYEKEVLLASAGILLGYMFQGVAESLWYNMRMFLMFCTVIAFIATGAKIGRSVENDKIVSNSN